MNKNKFFGVGMVAMLLTFGLVLARCSMEDLAAIAGGGGFVRVTGIVDAPTIAIAGKPLTLTGTAQPSYATNKTIVWSGTHVSNGILTAPSAGGYTVTATITNGESESSPYTKTFNIQAIDAGINDGTNPFFGTIWAKDDAGGTVYVTIVDNDSWVATVDGKPYNNGTYTRIGKIVLQWTVTGGGYLSHTGVTYTESDSKMRVANFTGEYSEMNGTFTKLDTTKTLVGTWQSNHGYHDSNTYVRIIADAEGNFTEYHSPNPNVGWFEFIKGTYTGKNPATCTITHFNTRVFVGDYITWEPWNSLSNSYKRMAGGSQIFTVMIYADKCEATEYILQKQ